MISVSLTSTRHIAATTFKWVGDLRCTQMLY